LKKLVPKLTPNLLVGEVDVGVGAAICCGCGCGRAFTGLGSVSPKCTRELIGEIGDPGVAATAS